MVDEEVIIVERRSMKDMLWAAAWYIFLSLVSIFESCGNGQQCDSASSLAVGISMYFVRSAVLGIICIV